MSKKTKRRIVVVLVNFAIMMQIVAVMLLSAFGLHIVATLVALAICLSMFAWGWFGYQKVAYFGFFSSLLVFAASLPGLFLKFISVGEAFFIGVMAGVFGFTILVFFDAYYVKDLLDLD